MFRRLRRRRAIAKRAAELVSLGCLFDDAWTQAEGEWNTGALR